MRTVDAGQQYLNRLSRDIQERARKLDRAVSEREDRALAIAYLESDHVFELKSGGKPVEGEPHEVMTGATAKALNEALVAEFQRLSVEEFRAGIPFRESKAKLFRWCLVDKDPKWRRHK